MNLVINLTPIEEARLSSEAKQSGLEASELAENLVRQHLESGPVPTTDMILAKLHQWQEETGTVTSPSISAHDLFAQWDEEDAQMTDEEREAEDRLWQDVQNGMNETRASLGMRQL